MIALPFPEKDLVFSKDLPLTCMSLEEWTLIRVHGKDVIQYLHNQFTCDIKNLNKNKYSFSAYCSPKGKIFSNMYVFYIKHQEIAFIVRLNIYKKQILEMKKYAIFSDVTITSDKEAILIGVSGTNSKQYLSTFFTTLPDHINTIIHDNNITLLYFNSPIERFLLIIYHESVLHHLLDKSKYYVQLNNSRQWTLLDMEAGYPIIESRTSGIFIPQAVNMDALQGISFNKGCYMGQESIARIKYRGNNKQILYCFSGFTNCKKNHTLPILSGDQIELKINNQYWKNIGIILQSCNVNKNNLTLIQTVSNRPILKNMELKIVNISTNSYFTLFVLDVYK